MKCEFVFLRGFGLFWIFRGGKIRQVISYAMWLFSKKELGGNKEGHERGWSCQTNCTKWNNEIVVGRLAKNQFFVLVVNCVHSCYLSCAVKKLEILRRLLRLEQTFSCAGVNALRQRRALSLRISLVQNPVLIWVQRNVLIQRAALGVLWFVGGGVISDNPRSWLGVRVHNAIIVYSAA